MKTMILTLAAVLGLAVGIASLGASAHATQIYRQPTENGQG
jgi:hypothetical protein